MIHLDFETFSAAGLDWDPIKRRWLAVEGCSSSKKGLLGIGAEPYAAHPSTRVLCMAWDREIWSPGEPPPIELWQRIDRGELISAWNSLFEFWVWRYCLHKRHSWPDLPLRQLVDSMPRARAWSIPGGLGGAAKVLGLAQQKDTGGGALIRKFCIPRNPTKSDPRLVIRVEDDPNGAAQLREYCRQDVATEHDASLALPELSEYEQRVWRLDQEINVRGIPLDVEAVDNACEILRQAARVLDAEISAVTGGAVPATSNCEKLKVWAVSRGVKLGGGMTADEVDEYLERPDLPTDVRRALKLRKDGGSSSTKKVWAMRRTLIDGRVYGCTTYCGASRTGRFSGRGMQPHNFPRPEALVCVSEGIYSQHGERVEWCQDATIQFLGSMASRDYVYMEEWWGDVLECMGSSLRGFIKAAAGYELIGSDLTAIEAVVLAVISGQQWRVDVFNGHGKIYETSAAKITGKTVEFYAAHKEEHGEHHPDRKLGKLAELASGFQGGVGAWIRFGAGAYFTPERCEEYREGWEGYRKRDTTTLQEYAIQKQVWAWREASPKIEKFWGDVDTAAKAAIMDVSDESLTYVGDGCDSYYRPQPVALGATFTVGLVSFQVVGKVLYCTLPSGRRLAYHDAHIGPGKYGPTIYYRSWVDGQWRLDSTYGGKLVENITQAIARDILVQGMLNCDAAGYPIILTVHDEIIAEVPHGFGSVEELEALMGELPEWAKGWPVRAAGGYRGERFRK